MLARKDCGYARVRSRTATDSEKPRKLRRRFSANRMLSILLLLTVLLTGNAATAAVTAEVSADVTVSVDRSTRIGTSQMSVGTTHGQYSADPWGDAGAVARAKGLMQQGVVYQNQHIYGWGAGNPSPSPGRYDWATLDRRVELMRSTGAIPVITLCCAPDWMTSLGTNTSTFRNLPPTAAHFNDFAELARQIALRYPDVNHFVVWNEMKGFWDGGTEQWNYVAYTTLYNKVYDALKSVRAGIKVGGPYLVLKGTGSNLGPWFSAPPIHRQNMLVIDYWLANKRGADFIASNRPVRDYHDHRAYTQAELLSFTRWFGEIVTQLKAKTTLPVWFIEEHFAGKFGGPVDFQSVGAASMLLHQTRAGAAASFQWQPEQLEPGGPNWGNLWTSTRQAGGGQPYPTYFSYKLFRDHFAPGTPLFRTTSSAVDVEALASDTKTLLINKRPTSVTVAVNGRLVTLNTYEVRLLDPSGNTVTSINGGTTSTAASSELTFDECFETGGAEPLGLSSCATTASAQADSAALAAAPGLRWVRQFGTADADDRVEAVAADASGVYLAGGTYGRLPGQASGAYQDAFVVKYDANGNVVWTRQFGNASDNNATGIAINATGVYVAGSTDGPLPGSTGVGLWDAFVRKYDANGNALWTRQFGTAGNDGANGIAVDSTGVYVVGYTDGAFPGTTRRGYDDAYIRKYDVNGNELWTRQLGTATADYANAVAANDSGVYLAGGTAGVMAGGSNAGIWDAFVRKYDSAGNPLWTQQFGTAFEDRGTGIAVDSSGVYVTGYVEGALPNQSFSGVYDAYLRKLAFNGSTRWTRQFGTASNDQGISISSTPTAVYVVGWTTGAMPGSTSAGNVDVIIQAYDPNGAALWSRQFGGSGSDHTAGVSAVAAVAYIGGSTNGALPGQTYLGRVDAFISKWE